MMQDVKLSPRLAAAAAMTGKGSLADVGTDHALLPIWLVGHGAPRALASDINEGPCERARLNIAAAGMADRIMVKCCPGLDGIEDFAPDNIIIAGMGGELIAAILEASAYPKASRCRIVMQPMTMQDVLRRYLAENGFAIDAETVVLDGGKYYQLLAASYTGERFALTEAQLRYGAINLERALLSPTEADLGWMRVQKQLISRRMAGRAAGVATDEAAQAADAGVLEMINKILTGGTRNADGI